PHTFLTAIAKSPVQGPVAVRTVNLAGDAQADTKHHGGPDKAVHAHFVRHLHWWGVRRGWPVAPGELGENLTLGAPAGGHPPDETDFCIGDVLAAGSAILQVTQPRIPCFKQAAALHINDAVQLAGETGRTGIYMRVLQEGTLQAGDALVLLERPNARVTLADANRFVHQARRDVHLRSRLAACAGLGSELRRLLAASSEG
ncbi:MAG TPA: MOSC domain-containing protein, partial [Bacillota bacterium]|nr:MOSC domain-containing protein [Bacillota bacterium]